MNASTSHTFRTHDANGKCRFAMNFTGSSSFEMAYQLARFLLTLDARSVRFEVFRITGDQFVTVAQSK